MFQPEEVNVIGALSRGFFAGVQAGRQEVAEISAWEPTIRGINLRWAQVTYQRVTKPLPAMQAVPSLRQIFGEAIACYCYGLANSAVFGVGRSLEVALAEAYKQKEQKTPPDKLVALIDWCGALESRDKELGSSCRLLRNAVHTDQLIPEQAALEAIRNSSVLINKVFPYSEDHHQFNYSCPTCQNVQLCQIGVNDIYYGNQLTYACSYCQASYHVPVNL